MFWSDGICRKNYKAFGTVITFDTTYKVNAYKKPLVVIIGVNNHRKAVPFIVALVTDETEVTYRWVLQWLLEADGCSTSNEFEEAWEELMQIYNVQELRWAQEMYEKKEKWSEAFMHGLFFAGMRSTQRFVQLYDRVLEKIRFEEDQDDYISTHTFPVIHSILGEIKTQAALTYTSAM
ncbi:Protein FAR1-RELATED SEQUENCE 7 [Bienertia sinuspersici]